MTRKANTYLLILEFYVKTRVQNFTIPNYVELTADFFEILFLEPIRRELLVELPGGEAGKQGGGLPGRGRGALKNQRKIIAFPYFPRFFCKFLPSLALACLDRKCTGTRRSIPRTRRNCNPTSYKNTKIYRKKPIFRILGFCFAGYTCCCCNGSCSS